jgi:glycosyltransferase involved in cell wall biosynthesis
MVQLKKVVIVSGIQIINNPRVVKEANALSSAGYDVSVIGAVFDPESRPRIEMLLREARWKHLPVIDLSRGLWDQKLKFLLARVRFRSWRLVKQYLNMEAVGQLGYFPKKLYRMARQESADLYIVHLEQALWAGQRLLRDGFKVAADFEDWYSEDCLAADRRLRPENLLKRCEAILLRDCACTTTTSNALAEALANEYGCEKPALVYNSFPDDHPDSPVKSPMDRENTAIPSITWFSQTIGPGRGLEELTQALATIEAPFELHIRGTPRPGFCEHLKKNLAESQRPNLFFHGQVPQHELPSRLAEHDIGFCGELSEPASRDLTITNKVLECMRAGLAIVASDTRGQLEVASMAPAAVRTYRQNDRTSLTRLLRELLTDRSALNEAKRASREGFIKHFDWPASASRLVGLVENAVGPAA